VIGKARRISAMFKREQAPSAGSLATAVSVYFFGALGIYKIDPSFLLGAWLFSGFLLLTVYFTFEMRGSLLNPYTLFFAAMVAGCLGGYVATV
jgi:hypothetical protein